jgi:hypothetical protein
MCLMSRNMFCKKRRIYVASVLPVVVIKGKNVKVFLCLTKHYAIKMYTGVGV